MFIQHIISAVLQLLTVFGDVLTKLLIINKTGKENQIEGNLLKE